MDDPPEAHDCPCGRDARAPRDVSHATWLIRKDDGVPRVLEVQPRLLLALPRLERIDPVHLLHGEADVV